MNIVRSSEETLKNLSFPLKTAIFAQISRVYATQVKNKLVTTTHN